MKIIVRVVYSILFTQAQPEFHFLPYSLQLELAKVDLFSEFSDHKDTKNPPISNFRLTGCRADGLTSYFGASRRPDRLLGCENCDYTTEIDEKPPQEVDYA